MMLARRMLLVRPALYLSAQARTFGFARIALAARKTPPPPPPARKKAATAKKASTTHASKTTTKKAAPAKKASTTLSSKAATRKGATSKKAGTTRRPSKTTTKRGVTASRAPIHRRLTDREKAARARAREQEKVARAKRLEREKVAKAKQREREKVTRVKRLEREKVIRAQRLERAKVVREKRKVAKEKARERAKEKVAKAKEKRHEMKVRAREREKARKEKAKLKAEQAKALKKPYPPPPKRPAAGYIMFASDPNVKRDRSGRATESAIKAGAAWRALSDAEREAYNKKAEKARAQWKEDVAKWVSSLNFAQLTAARANREPGTRDESALKTLPKRPANAYGMFMAEANKRPDFRNKVETLAKKESGGDDNKLHKMRIGLFGRTLGNTWKSMTEKEKAVYAAKSADAKKQWEKTYGSILAAQREALVSAHS